MRRLVEERGLALSVDSAGLRAESVIAPKTVRALERRGIAVHERTAVQLTGEMVERASLVLCMSPRIGQAADRGWAYDVPDPWGQDDAVYEATAATIEALAVATLRVLATRA